MTNFHLQDREPHPPPVWPVHLQVNTLTICYNNSCLPRAQTEVKYFRVSTTNSSSTRSASMLIFSKLQYRQSCIVVSECPVCPGVSWCVLMCPSVSHCQWLLSRSNQIPKGQLKVLLLSAKFTLKSGSL